MYRSMCLASSGDMVSWICLSHLVMEAWWLDVGELVWRGLVVSGWRNCSGVSALVSVLCFLDGLSGMGLEDLLLVDGG